MEIAIFTWNFIPNLKDSLGIHVSEVSIELDKLGHDVTVFALNTGELPTRAVFKGLEIHRPMILETEDISQLLVKEDLRQPSDDFLRVFSYNHASTSTLFQLIRTEKRAVASNRLRLADSGVWIDRQENLSKDSASFSHAFNRGKIGCSKTYQKEDGRTLRYDNHDLPSNEGLPCCIWLSLGENTFRLEWVQSRNI